MTKKPGGNLLELKRRLEKKKVNRTRPIRCMISHDGTVVSDHTFDQKVVKIGRLPSSELCLDAEGVARLHAVLERSADEWRVIDMGSSSGSKLDGVHVKSADLPPKGRLEFGPFEVQYQIGEGSLADLVDDVAKASLDMYGDHHKAMMEGLMDEMSKLAPTSHREASFMRKGWHIFDEVKKRKYLRMMV